MPQGKHRRFRRRWGRGQLSGPEEPAAVEAPKPNSTRREFLTMFFPKEWAKPVPKLPDQTPPPGGHAPVAKDSLHPPAGEWLGK